MNMKYNLLFKTWTAGLRGRRRRRRRRRGRRRRRRR
jgi:hypothetical protein